MSAAPRHVLKAALKPLLPRGWKIIPYQNNPDTPSSVVVMLKLLRIARMEEAPDGAHTLEFTVTIISPHDDIEKAEDALDDQVLELTFALDTLGILWTAAEKVIASDRLAYDITVTLVSTKE